MLEIHFCDWNFQKDPSQRRLNGGQKRAWLDFVVSVLEVCGIGILNWYSKKRGGHGSPQWTVGLTKKKDYVSDYSIIEDFYLICFSYIKIKSR